MSNKTEELVENKELGVGEMPAPSPQKILDFRGIKDLAKKEGLMSLLVEQLEILAKGYSLDISGRKKEIAKRIMGSKQNAQDFVLGQPVGFVKLKGSVQGFKKGNFYPIDREREKFFIDTKVI